MHIKQNIIVTFDVRYYKISNLLYMICIVIISQESILLLTDPYHSNKHPFVGTHIMCAYDFIILRFSTDNAFTRNTKVVLKKFIGII